MSKCMFYLIGLQYFSLVIDHRPLVPILNHYSLDAIENLCLQRLKMKISPYIFTATWRAGKVLCIPDALSCSPVDRPTSDDEAICNKTCISVSAVMLCAVKTIAVPCVNEQDDLHLEDLHKAASEYTKYRDLLHHVRSGFPNDRYDLQNSLCPYWKIRDDLYCGGNLVLYGARMVIPTALRCCILTRLHDSHCGFEATKRRVRQTVYWPGIDADILNTICACEPCQILQPSQQQDPLASDDYLSVSADFFSVAGKHFLVYVDRFSNWPIIIQCGTDTTARTTIRFFRHLFRDLGVPERVRTDGGPQFTSQEFAAFLERWGVCHIMSTPHYPQSNGHAEAAVKKVKYFTLKTVPTGNIDHEAFERGLLELCYTLNFAGCSAQIFFGHSLHSCVPAHAKSFTKEWQSRAESCECCADECAKDVETRYNKPSKQDPELFLR
ncbi:uncharacterized protein K02A2.6-like [Penaeus japonicus]|uniref:uncharacterized protein K02A2.6-like n=1 Tax=Penaeus japonicus TaxID=27405 RepID=UPI001C710101|nr:uncharacterized protein K02A2.6-like [Penaeus japonicus]